MKTRHLLSGLLLCAALTLGGCQSALESSRTSDGSSYWTQMRAKLTTITNLHVQGRLGLVGRQTRGSASFDYESKGDDFVLDLATTFGSGIAVINSSGGKAWTTTSGKLVEADSADELLRDLYGIDIPAAELKQAFLGLPVGEYQLDAQGRLQHSRLGRYTISYTDFKEFNGYALPVNMTISNSQEDIKVKINKVLDVQ